MAGTSTQVVCRKDHEDYISLLPDGLIHHIFSFLPTRDVIKTCVLSKRWPSVWTTISDLRFDSFYDNSFVDGVLKHYVWPKVKKFHLDMRSKQDFCYSNIDLWVHFAIDHQVEDLRLILNIYWEHYTLSPLLYNCSSLTKLCLRGCIFSSSEGIRWSSLKSLSVQNVSDDVLWKILMGSPVLEYLNLISCQGVKRIHSKSLRELVIDALVLESPLEISTPHLLSLHVRGDNFHEMIRIIEAPLLVDAELDFDGPVKSDYSMLKELLCKLQNATQILLGAWCIRCESDFNSRNVDHESYWHTKKKFQSWARYLKNVEILGFYTCLRIKYEEVLVLVKFLLGHASILENMVIKVKSKREVVDSHRLLEVTQRLESFHRASKHAAVILNYLEEGLEKRWNITTNRLRIDHENN